MKKDVLLVTNYWHFESEKASSRYLTLANMLAGSGANLEVVTSTFYHATKSQRKYDEHFLNSFPYKVSLLYEAGYSNNISLKRIISHRQFSKNVLKYLKYRKKPDIIYCVVPSLDVARSVSKFANENDIKVIVDIQDLWPEAYKMIFNVPVLSDIIFSPMKRTANKVYSAADKIVAVSETYVNRALEVNNKSAEGYSVFLGTELLNFDKIVADFEPIRKPENEIWIAYIGTLGYSYDIPSIIDALSSLMKSSSFNMKFLIMGDGPLRDQFEQRANDSRINHLFTGRLKYTEMIRYLCACDIAVNPIVGNSAASIINKVGDYAAAGLPVVNTQDCKEYKELLDNYNAGLNCKNGDVMDIASSIEKLCEDSTLRKLMGENNRKLAEERFDRERTYKKIVDLVQEI